jgi:xanthine dehydrogenase accessory factor
MTVTQEDILARARDWRNQGRGVALATVVRTWGSSPRPVGSHLAVEQGGDFVGSVSGGCIEGTVIQEALGALAQGKPRMLDFGVTDEQAWEVGLACGGRVQVYAECLPPAALLDPVIDAQARNRPAALVTRLADGAKSLWQEGALSGALELAPGIVQEIGASVQANRSGPVTADEGLFLRVYAPAPRLIVVGAVHIAQALAPMAELAGFQVVIIDPRRAFARASLFPGVELSEEWPDEAMARLAPDGTTAVVTLTHDPKLDEPALVAALASPAFYIGSLGSSRTHARRLERLRAEGVDPQALGRIHAPVGLDLGGRMPAEIAVAILAQILQVRYRGRS